VKERLVGIRSRGSALIVLAALLLAACGGGGPDLTTHAGQHQFADEVCADLVAASSADAPGMLHEAFADAAKDGVSEEQIREILNEECPDVVSAVGGWSFGRTMSDVAVSSRWERCRLSLLREETEMCEASRQVA
jgi:hypothetical protein